MLFPIKFKVISCFYEKILAQQSGGHEKVASTPLILSGPAHKKILPHVKDEGLEIFSNNRLKGTTILKTSLI